MLFCHQRMGDGGGGRCTVIKLFMIVVSWQNFGSTQCLHQLGVKQQSKTLSFGPPTDQLEIAAAAVHLFLSTKLKKYHFYIAYRISWYLLTHSLNVLLKLKSSFFCCFDWIGWLWLNKSIFWDWIMLKVLIYSSLSVK